MYAIAAYDILELKNKNKRSMKNAMYAKKGYSDGPLIALIRVRHIYFFFFHQLTFRAFDLEIRYTLGDLHSLLSRTFAWHRVITIDDGNFLFFSFSSRNHASA